MTDTPPGMRTPPPPPPKAKASPPPPTGASAGKKPSPPKNLQGQLEEFFLSVGAAMMVAGDIHCGEVFTRQAKPLAQAYARVAEKNPKLKEWFSRLTAGGVYGEAIAVTLATTLPILAHHSPAFREKIAGVPFVSLFAIQAQAADDAAKEAQEAMARMAANGNGHPAPGA